eukprot:gene10943-3015_t
MSWWKRFKEAPRHHRQAVGMLGIIVSLYGLLFYELEKPNALMQNPSQVKEEEKR